MTETEPKVLKVQWKTETRHSGRLRLRACDLLALANAPRIAPNTEIHLTFVVHTGSREMVVTQDSNQDDQRQPNHRRESERAVDQEKR